MKKRILPFQKLAVKFSRELDKTFQKLSVDERIEFINTLIEIVVLFENKADYAEISKVVEEKLMMSFRHKMKDFVNAQVLDYLNQKSTKLYELQDDLGITGDEQQMSDEEYSVYLATIKNMLGLLKDFAMVAEPNVPSEEEQTSVEELQGNNPEDTSRRQTLAIHYVNLFTQLNKGPDIALARFIRFMTGKSLDNITKVLRNPLKVASEKRKRADEELLKDLTYIKQFFEGMGLPQILVLIDRDMEAIRKG